jgi:hypothetical protein
MRILFDHQIFSTQKYGGISRYFVEIASKISSFGEEVCVSAPIYQNYYLKESGKHLSKGLYFNAIPPKTGRIIREMNRQLSKWTISCWKPDIVHETYYALNSVAKKNIVLTVYDMIHEIFPDLFSSSDITSVQKKKLWREQVILYVYQKVQKMI